MKRNCEFIDLGEFEMTSPVMRVSDPCYERDVWCCGTVDHCKLGTWEAGVLKTDEGEWGTRCAVLAVRHKDTGPDFNVIRLGKVRKVACKCVEQSFEVGVDKSSDELPLILNVQEVSNFLGLGLSQVYELVKRIDFPAFKVGSRIFVPKDKFLTWLDVQTAEKDALFYTE